MALFSRKDRKADIDRYITEAVEKAAQSLMGTPMYNQAGYANVVPAQPIGGQGLAQQSGWEATALPRPGDAFGSMLGPAAPLLPSPIDPVNPDTGRAEPRKFQFQVAYNLNLTQQDVPWSVLRALADQCDIIARAITIRVSEIVKMNWSFTLSDLAITEIMAEQNVSHAQAAKIGRDKYKNQISQLTEFWENPYPQADRGWSEWITEFGWQHLVYDGVPVYPQYNLGGKVIGFNIIDAPTIKILLDNRGDIPRPPAPAFQQILWGFPRGEFTASPDSDVDGEYYADAEGTSFKTDTLAYFIRNRRTWSPYGFSAVEQAIPAATLYLERQRWFIDDFQAGTMPMTFMKTDSQEIDHLRLAAFERVFNDKMVGSSEERHKIKVLPKGFDPVIAPEMTERYKPEMDEYIIKKIASIFGIAPSQLGVVARAGLGGGKGAHDGEEQSAETVSARPMENFIVEVINSLCRRFLSMDKNITFNLEDRSTAENEAEKAKAYQTALSSGTMTLNDARGDMGLPLYDMKEADEPFILTAAGPVFLKGTLDSQQQQAQAQAQGATSDQAQPGKDGEAPQDTQSSESAPQPDNGKGKDKKTGVAPENQTKSVVADEMRDFAQFVKSRNKRGNWRAFDFSTIDESLAEKLNEEAYFMVKGARPIPEKLATWAIEYVEREISDTPKGRSLTKGYNPDQERDSHGRFGSGSGDSTPTWAPTGLSAPEVADNPSLGGFTPKDYQVSDNEEYMMGLMGMGNLADSVNQTTIDASADLKNIYSADKTGLPSSDPAYTASQVESIKSYESDEGCAAINGDLVAGTESPAVATDIANLDKAISDPSNTTQTDIVTYRGLSGFDLASTAQVGEVYSYAGFSSTSLVAGVAASFSGIYEGETGTMMEISIPAGSQVLPLVGQGGYEMLLGRDAAFRVDSLDGGDQGAMQVTYVGAKGDAK